MSESDKRPLGLWVEELHEDFFALRYRVLRTLYSGESDFQQIDIVETAGFGRMLFNDGVAMVSERDEFVYHEMISHVPLFVHPGVRRALVIGGGDGGTVREILRHDSVEHCRLVEIDPLVVEGCKRHLPLTAGALDDPRVEVTIADGVRFVADSDESYDLVIVDSTDPIGPAKPLFGPRFYADVRRRLARGGIVVSQAESTFLELERQRALLGVLRDSFARVYLYNYVNMTYPGGLWSFSLASDAELCPLGDFDAARVSAADLEFRYYGAAVHRAAFALPAFQSRLLADYLTPLSVD